MAAARMVAATVVAPTSPLTMAGPRSRELTLTAPAATRSRSAALKPMRTFPSSTATLAGMPPSCLIAASLSNAARRL